MADILPRPQINPPRRVQDVTPPPAPPPPASATPASPPSQAEVVEIAPPANDLEVRLRDMLTSEGIERSPNLVNFSGGPAPGNDGLLAARNDLDTRAREGAKMVRLVDRHRQQLERAEQDLEAMQEKLGQLIPVLGEATGALKAAMRSTRRGDEVQALGDQFTRSGAAVDELEALAGHLSAQLLWTRSAWEQYCKTIAACQRLRNGQATS